uniref:F-box associated beta-propeller type 1 domain-containing protein n=1 Tax=Chenopodium quinoa TaxID=63459 RepID=A0A803NDE3_CHEQI
MASKHFSDVNSRVQLIGSCNGVVCISTVSKTRVVLYNPLTNSHLKLPSVTIPVPDLNKMVLGFGYDSNNDDYKVLRIVQGVGLLDDSTNKAQVYSFNDNCWRCIEGIPYYLYYGYYHGNLVNEGLHYVVTQESHSERLFIARMLVNAELWVMKEYGNKESWIKLLCISQPQTIGIRKCAKAVVYSKDGRRVLLEIDGLEYGWYDLESEMWVKVL